MAQTTIPVEFGNFHADHSRPQTSPEILFLATCSRTVLPILNTSVHVACCAGQQSYARTRSSLIDFLLAHEALGRTMCTALTKGCWNTGRHITRRAHAGTTFLVKSCSQRMPVSRTYATVKDVSILIVASTATAVIVFTWIPSRYLWSQSARFYAFFPWW